jgi:hypothetical protein
MDEPTKYKYKSKSKSSSHSIPLSFIICAQILPSSSISNLSLGPVIPNHCLPPDGVTHLIRCVKVRPRPTRLTQLGCGISIVDMMLGESFVVVEV